MASTSSESEPSEPSEPRNECIPPARAYYNKQLCLQDSFWRTTIHELKNHIHVLEAQKEGAECAIRSIESSLVPYITCLMIELSMESPDLNINSLLSLEINASCSNPCLYADIPPPDLTMLECFTVQDNDIFYMDMIKVLAKEANDLKSRIDRLKQQEKALLDTKKQIDEIFTNLNSGTNKIIINGNKVICFHNRLIDNQAELKNNICVEKVRSTELKHEFCHLKKQIIEEEKRNADLNDQLNYAGANLDISTLVTAAGGKGFCLDGKSLEDFQKEMNSLKAKYDKLKKEWTELIRETETATTEYKRKKCQELYTKYGPGNTQTCTQDSDFCICE